MSKFPVWAASLLLGLGLLTQPGAAAEAAWVVVDARSGEVLGQENATARIPPASLAKMMTLYLTFEALRAGKLRWDDRIAVSRNASRKIPMKLWVKPGDTISVREAVNGMVVISANDAAAAIGEHVAGSEAAYARLMTRRGKKLGLKNTVFANPSGLTEKGRVQLTTARDMATLGRALQRDFPAEYQLFSQPSFVYRGKRLKGHNNLMYRYGGVDGIKTGYTARSGYNIATSLDAPGRRKLVGVYLGGRTAGSRDDRMAELLTRYSGSSPAIASAEPARSKPATPAQDDYFDETIEQGDAGPVPQASLPSWQIQVGALPDQASARALISKVDHIVSTSSRTARPRIELTEKQGGKLYRVRFDGLEKVEAAKACEQLIKRKFDCFVLQGG